MVLRYKSFGQYVDTISGSIALFLCTLILFGGIYHYIKINKNKRTLFHHLWLLGILAFWLSSFITALLVVFNVYRGHTGCLFGELSSCMSN